MKNKEGKIDTNGKMSFNEYFTTYIKSGFPLMLIDTIEVDRATTVLYSLTEKLNTELPTYASLTESIKVSGFAFAIWNCLRGWRLCMSNNKTETIVSTVDSLKALEYVLGDNSRAGIYIMENFHLQWSDPLNQPLIIQLVRDIYQKCKSVGKHLFFVGSIEGLPKEIEKYFAVLDFGLPTQEVIHDYITKYVSRLNLKFSDQILKDAASSATGLTVQEVENAVSVAIVRSKGTRIDKSIIFEEKAKTVKRSGLLEYISTNETLATVGDLPRMKDWFKCMAKPFCEPEKAKAYGLSFPKGCIIAGISGTGKTLSAKAIANLFGAPLFRADFGKLYGGFVGDTEKNTRNLISLLKVIYPAVILCDEFEKFMTGLSGEHSNVAASSDVTVRMIGEFLYFLEENELPLFFAATVNQLLTLPPELIRRGRFEAVWFVDLPSPEGREEIFNIHLKKTGRDIGKFKHDLKSMVQKSDGFTGAEIEGNIRDAMFAAFKQDREFTSKDILFAIENTVPLAVTKSKEIKSMRLWAKGNAKLANEYYSEVGDQHWAAGTEAARNLIIETEEADEKEKEKEV